MNKVQLNNYVRTLAIQSPLIHSFYTDSVYECWNTKEVEYGSLAFCIKEARESNHTTTYSAIIYYGDRLNEDRSNVDAIQSDAVLVLQSLVSIINNSEQNIEVSYPVSYQLFEQKFNDELAGAYANIQIVVEGYNECEILGGFLEDYATKEWVLAQGYATEAWVLAQGFAYKDYVDAEISRVEGLIPDIDDYATKEYVDEGLEELKSEIKQCDCFPYISLDKVNDYFYESSYGALDYAMAKEYFKSKAPEINMGACISLRKDNKFGRNLDWLYSEQVDFVVRTNNTIGIAGGLSGLTRTVVEEDKKNELFKIMPFYLQDGINKHGVFANINVVPVDAVYGPTTYTEPWISKQEEICSLMLVRYIIDNFKTAADAVAYIRDYVSVYMPTGLIDMGYEVHFMVGDKNNTYVIEFINNRVFVLDREVMSNFYLKDFIPNEDGTAYSIVDVPDHIPSMENGLRPMSAGVERYNIAVKGLADDTDFRELMNSMLYTKSYSIPEGESFWYSEFVGGDRTIDSEASEFSATIAAAKNAYINRRRDNPITWQTTHSCIYDLDNLSINVVSQEDFQHQYEFRYTDEDKCVSKEYVDQEIARVEAEIPSLEGYATEEYVDNKVSGIGDEIDEVSARVSTIESYMPNTVSPDNHLVDLHTLGHELDELQIVMEGEITDTELGIKQWTTDKLEDKQDKLTAGTGITIVNNVISVTSDVGSEQSDWDETNQDSPAYIKNKPDLSQYATVTALNELNISITNRINNIESEITNLSQYATVTALSEAISEVNSVIINISGRVDILEDVIDTKQDIISDLDVIREGAYKGQTSVQPGDLAEYATVTALSNLNISLISRIDSAVSSLSARIDEKQGTITDLEEIREGAALGRTAVQPGDLEDYATVTALSELNLSLISRIDSAVSEVEEWVENKGYLTHVSAVDVACEISSDSFDITNVYDGLSQLVDFSETSREQIISISGRVDGVEAAIDTKQDIITDIEEIREGAYKGQTAVQPGDLAAYATVTALSELNLSMISRIDSAVSTLSARIDTKQNISNMVTVVNPMSDDAHYPSAKATYDACSAVTLYTDTHISIAISNLSVDIDEKLAGKQDKLIAGANISIVDNVISATGGGGTGDWNDITNKPAWVTMLSGTTTLGIGPNVSQTVIGPDDTGCSINIDNNIKAVEIWALDGEGTEHRVGVSPYEGFTYDDEDVATQPWVISYVSSVLGPINQMLEAILHN